MTSGGPGTPGAAPGWRAVLRGRIAAAPRRHLFFATLMTAIAGYLDAVGYFQLGHLYVSFMSGNSTQLGMALADGRNVALILAIIGAFVLGSALGTFVADGDADLAFATILAGEVLALLGAILLALFGMDRIGLALVAVAMGMQNTLHQVIAGADIGKGFITGALFGFGQALARHLRGTAKLAQSLSNLLSWGAFVGGVVLGAWTLAAIGVPAALAVAALALGAATAAICLGAL